MGTNFEGKSMKEYTTFEIITLWKRAKDDPFILRYLSELTGVSVDDIVYMLECYGYQPTKTKKTGRPEKYSDSTLDWIEREMGRENITLREVCKKHGFVYSTIYNLMSTRKGGH